MAFLRVKQLTFLVWFLPTRKCTSIEIQRHCLYTNTDDSFPHVSPEDPYISRDKSLQMFSNLMTFEHIFFRIRLKVPTRTNRTERKRLFHPKLLCQPNARGILQNNSSLKQDKSIRRIKRLFSIQGHSKMASSLILQRGRHMLHPIPRGLQVDPPRPKLSREAPRRKFAICSI